MSTLELYEKLVTLNNRHIINNTKINTYINNVIRLVKQYLKDKE